MGFEQITRTLAREFLQSIVVVDDQADYGVGGTEVGESDELLDPVEVSFVVASPAVDPDADQEVSEFIPRKDLKEHALDAKLLIDRFADEGIVCSVILPADHELDRLKDKVCAVAGRADIVVLDWVLHGDESGERTLQIIEALAEAPKQHRRSRLIAVYSGQRQPIDIRDRIEARLRATEVATEPTQRHDDYTLVRGPVRIAIYSKRYVPTVDPATAERKVSEFDFPARLIDEFARMTDGIVPNVVVDALAQIRRNTHRLLSTFHRGLDAPLLNHRTMLPQPDDAKAFIRSLVSAEIGSLLNEYDVGERTIKADSIYAWLEREAKERAADNNAEAKVFALPVGNVTFNLSAAEIGRLIEHGVTAWDGAPLEPEGQRAKLLDKLSDKGYQVLTAALARTGEDAENLDYEFAALSALRTRYRDDDAPPTLTLGTIVRRVPPFGAPAPAEADTYWLCVQAPCDSVRVDAIRKYPLLPLNVVVNNGKFHLVIRDGTGAYIRVRIGKEPYNVDLVPFSPSEGQVVRARRIGELFVFVPVDPTYQYEWVADLRFEHSQRATDEHATRATRIGLDEYEWLRRWAPA
jgi:Response receiver domain